MHDVSNLKSNRRLYLDHLIWVCSHTSLKALMRPFDAQMAVSVLTNWVTYANSILIDGDKNNGRKPTVSRSEQKALLKHVNHKESRDFFIFGQNCQNDLTPPLLLHISTPKPKHCLGSKLWVCPVPRLSCPQIHFLRVPTGLFDFLSTKNVAKNSRPPEFFMS